MRGDKWIHLPLSSTWKLKSRFCLPCLMEFRPVKFVNKILQSSSEMIKSCNLFKIHAMSQNVVVEQTKVNLNCGRNLWKNNIFCCSSAEWHPMVICHENIEMVMRFCLFLLGFLEFYCKVKNNYLIFEFNWWF